MTRNVAFVLSAEKEILRKLGEETIYSSKGHFKSSDIRKWEVNFALWLCAAINVLSLIGLSPCIDKILAGIGTFASIVLLNWNEGKGKEYQVQHKKVGELYLALHKNIRLAFLLDETNSSEEIKKLSAQVVSLDQTEKPDISWLGRQLAKKAIEKKDSETDNWFQ